ncbi:MAG: DUF4249 domain-containing protein [Mucilaginibacter sp.]
MCLELKKVLFVFAIILAAACKTPYTPAPITAVTNYLVVEGLINISDSTFIKLSRTVSISSASAIKPELKAIITIESNTGVSYPLVEVGNGNYAAPSYNLTTANQYRLRIKTSNGSTYVSDFGQTKVTPPIDSVIMDKQPNGLHIGVNTHDAKNATHYYRWDYSETWQFTSLYNSHWMSGGKGIVVVPRTNDIYHCWGNAASATILLNNTAGLSQDVLLNSPITYVNSSSEKLSVRYSILIRQYAMTQDAYNYWTLLKKNTEQLGSIFDSQPSASIGNLHNANNPAEPVIGYISVCTISQTRVYVNFTDLPKSYVYDYVTNNPYNKYTCGMDTVFVVERNKSGKVIGFPEKDTFITFATQIPVDVVIPYNPADSVGSHNGASPICVDCTLRGTNVKPAFWK